MYRKHVTASHIYAKLMKEWFHIFCPIALVENGKPQVDTALG